ncbi:tyrosine-type recombinase/integrase [Sulfurovum riftiae]|uniref:Tyr recombinase domain-containing protein n=1 Tax=Sulfurovum riftiae TaxID=1630136 RepID=A0A151CDS2_9BACT|nr:site-specific integrase [Sulfurovum riftiae]KYJ85665.1 hypothetical protein AS592_01120 [Sulfurovum riftiae]
MARIKSKKYAGVYLNHLANGDISYVINFKDQHGKKVWVTVGKKSNGINEKFAFAKRSEYVNKIKLGEDPLQHKKKKQVTTLDDLAMVYFLDKEAENKTNIRQIQKYNLYFGHIDPKDISSEYRAIKVSDNGKDGLGTKNIHSITKDDIQKLQKALKAKGKAPKTVNGIIQLLTAIINHSIKEKGLALTNPCTGVKRLKTDDSRDRYLSLDEVKQLIDKVQDNKTVYHFVKLALTTGARLEGVLHIQKKDINLHNSSITVHDLKSGGTYTGFFDDIYKAELTDHIKHLKANDYVVGGSDTKTTARTISRHLKPTLDHLFNKGLKVDDRKNRVVIHTLRHTFASQLAIAGVPILTIQKLLNHADITQTMRYAKLAPDQGSKAVKGLYQNKGIDK